MFNEKIFLMFAIAICTDESKSLVFKNAFDR